MSNDSTTSAGTRYRVSGNGLPLVMIHGVGMSKDIWKPQQEFFNPYFKVIQYDTYGHGGSPLPPDNAPLNCYLDQLVELLDHLHIERAHLMGHSMGALITNNFALQYPERVARIVPICGVYDRTPEHRERSLQTARTLKQQGAAATLDGTLKRWFTDADYDDPQRCEAIDFIRSFLASTDSIGYPRAYEYFAQHSDETAGKMHNLAAEALFITAEFDPNSTPLMTETMAKHSQHGRALVIANERHMLPTIAAEKINSDILKFLQNGHPQKT